MPKYSKKSLKFPYKLLQLIPICMITTITNTCCVKLAQSNTHCGLCRHNQAVFYSLYFCFLTNGTSASFLAESPLVRSQHRSYHTSSNFSLYLYTHLTSLQTFKKLGADLRYSILLRSSTCGANRSFGTISGSRHAIRIFFRELVDYF